MLGGGPLVLPTGLRFGWLLVHYHWVDGFIDFPTGLGHTPTDLRRILTRHMSTVRRSFISARSRNYEVLLLATLWLLCLLRNVRLIPVWPGRYHPSFCRALLPFSS